MREVTVDGKWTTTDEWSNATELQARGRAGYICIKDDHQFLYILLDFTSNVGLDEGDLARVRLDVNNDKSDRPLGDDYMILVDWMGDTQQTRVVEGNGTVWVPAEKDQGFRTASTTDPENDPYSDQPHLTYEFAIPRTIFGGRPQTGFSLTIGDKMRSSDASFINFPRKHHYMNPSTWATLEFATPAEQATIPTQTVQTPVTTSAEATVTSSSAQNPVPIMIALVAAVVIVGIYLLWRRPRRGGRSN